MSLRACFPTVIARHSLSVIASEAKQSQTAKRNVNNEDLTPRILVRWCPGKTGFTILELLVVLVIISMVIGMSIPAFSSYMRGSRLRSAAREISSTVMSARTYAITFRVDETVSFGLPGYEREFGIAGGERQILPPGIEFDNSGANFPTTGVILTSMGRADGTPHEIIIFSDEDGDGVLDNDMDSTPEPNEEAYRTIRVGALGHVKIE